MHRRQLLVLAAVAVAVGPRRALALDATPTAAALLTGEALGLPELALTLTDDAITGPASVPAGRYLVTVANQSTAYDAVQALLPPADLTVEEANARLVAMNGETSGYPEFAWIYSLPLAGGMEAQPGGSGQMVADLGPGRWLLTTIFGSVPRTTELNVTGEMPAALPEVKAAATVTALGTADGYDFALDGTIASGPQIVRFVNKSDQPHFIGTFTTPAPLTDDQFMALAAMAEDATPEPDSGLPRMDEIGEGPATGVISAGATMWWIADFAPGNYTLVCWMPDTDGTPHAMEGMVQQTVVE